MGEEIKLCAKCHFIKPVSEFNRNRWKKDGLQHYCRDCHRESVVESQKNHREAFLRRLQRHNERKRNENRRFVFEYLKAHPCIDCGESDIKDIASFFVTDYLRLHSATGYQAE